jgi:hypothetical protein
MAEFSTFPFPKWWKFYGFSIVSYLLASKWVNFCLIWGFLAIFELSSGMFKEIKQ